MKYKSQRDCYVIQRYICIHEASDAELSLFPTLLVQQAACCSSIRIDMQTV